MRKTPTTIAALAAGALLAIACGSGGADDTKGPGAQGEAAAADPKSDGKKTIVMEVTGAKKAMVTYGLNTDQSQESDAKLPWKKTLTSSEAVTIAVLSAQNAGSGTIKCKITMDGKVVKENTSKGEFAVVTCSADNF